MVRECLHPQVLMRGAVCRASWAYSWTSTWRVPEKMRRLGVVAVEAPLIGRAQDLARTRTVLEPDGPAAVVVRGPAGIGKSRLLEEVVASAEEWRVVRIFGAPAVGRVPFGAVSHLRGLDVLPDDPTMMFAHVRRAIVGTVGPSCLLVVDDAHELDELTSGVIHQIAAHGEARILLAVRERPAPPPSLAPLIGGSDTLRVDLEPLDQSESARLAEQLLGTTVDRELAEDLWRRTLGSPLFSTVLISAAETAGVLERVDGTVRAIGELPLESLHDLVRTRMGVLASPARAAIEVVAVGGRLSVTAVESIVGRDGLEAAVDHDFLDRDRADTVDVSHPVYAEAVLEEMSAGRRKEVAGAVVDALADESSVDRIRRAMLTLDAGRTLSAPEAAAAAFDALSRMDHQLCETLARAALAVDPNLVSGRLALARALALQGRGSEADEVLQDTIPETTEERAEVAIARGHVLAFLLRRPEEAADWLRTQADELPEPQRAALDADRTLYGAMRGSFGETIEAGERVLANPKATGLSKTRAATNLILARTMVGRFDGLERVIDDALKLAEEHSEVRPLARFQCDLTAASWHYLAGRVRQAADLSNARAVWDTQEPHPVWLHWSAFMLDAAGHFDEAVRSQLRAIEGYAHADPFRLRPQAMGMLGLHHGQMGHTGKDLTALLDEAAAEAGGEPRLTLWVGRGRAWTETVHSGVGPAAETAIAAGRHAAERDHQTWAGLAFHDVVRFGMPGLVRRDFDDLVAELSGVHLVETMADHAAALDDADVEALETVATRFARFGVLPLAVEVWCQLAKLHEARNQQTAARLAAARAAVIHRDIPTLGTPATRSTPSSLTDRELDVVIRAVAGNTSREIAETLFVSPRTVDNHLASVYRKLGMSGRDELAARLADVIAN